MLGRGMITAILALLLTATAAWAQGVGYGGAPVSVLLPGPPTNVTATAGNGQATVSFTTPKSDGGRPIIHYTVTSHPGQIKAWGKHSPITVKGLSNATAYTFTVTATNSAGTGLPSTTCSSVTPKAQ